jgi:CDP-diglyceride synthetase
MDQGWGLPTGQGPLLLYLAAMVGTLWLLYQARRIFWLFALLALPGTFCHEACHWVVGKLLNGRPVHFTILPRREVRGFVLGAVAFEHLRWYNAFFIGMAPLLLLPLAYGLLLWRLARQPALDWPEAGIVFLLANLLFGALPSWKDVRIAVRSPIGWLLLGGALAWGWMRFARPAPASPVTAGPAAR